MARNLFITTPLARSGKSIVALGVMECLTRQVDKLCYFRPIINVDDDSDQVDNDIHLIRTHYKLNVPYESMYAFKIDEARDLIAAGKQDDLLDGILSKYRKLEKRYDFILCEGTDVEDASNPLEIDINVEIANNLGCPLLIVESGNGKSIKQIRHSVKLTLKSANTRGAEIFAIIINRVDKDLISKLQSRLQKFLSRLGIMLFILPEEARLDKPNLCEVAKHLQATTICGKDCLEQPVHHYTVASMHVGGFLQNVGNHALVVVSGDRDDILLACAVARMSTKLSHVAGVVLTNGLLPQPQIIETIQHLSETPLAVLSVTDNTFTATNKLLDLDAVIRPEDSRKIALALGIFESNVDLAALYEKVSLVSSTRITPKMFEFRLIETARAKKQHIVLPEGEDERILRAAEILVQRTAVDLTLLGNVDKIRAKIASLGLDLTNIPICDPQESKYLPEFVKTYYKIRQHKGITKENAKDAMLDENYFGTMMVKLGIADGMVSGANHTTAQTIRPSFEIIKTKSNVALVSSVFFMCLRDRVLVYGDCAVNPNPNAEELADIAILSAETAALFGVKPQVAMLSYATGSSGKGVDVELVSQATIIAKKRQPDLLIEGPMQYDAAIDPGVAKAKMPNSKVAGNATVFIFPDLNTGNNTYKAVQRSAGAIAIGPVLQGLQKPVNDLSRGCLVDDIVNTVLITAIQAQSGK